MKQPLIFLMALAAALFGTSIQAVAAGKPNTRDLPLAAGLCVSRVNQLIQAEKFDEAILKLQRFQAKALDMNTVKAAKYGYSHYYIDFLQGNCLMMKDQKTNDPDLVRRAAAAYDRAVAKQPDFSPAWLNLAQCRYRLEDRVPAARAFIRGYETSEVKQADHLYYAAACYFFAEQHRKSLDIFERLLADHGDEVKLDWKEILVNTLFALERNRAALPWLRELATLSTGQKRKRWQEVLLYQYLTLEMKEEALSYAGVLTESDPVEPKWWKALTHIHLGENRMEQGLAGLMIYGFLTPLSRSETNLMADLYMNCNIPLEAARYYEAWLAGINAGAKPESGDDGAGENADLDTDKMADRILKIANAYSRGGDPARALEWIDRGLDLKKDAGLLRLKGDLLFRDRQYKAACAAYEQLAGVKAGQGSLMMGYAAWNANDMEVAVKAFTRAARYPKQKKNAQNALARIKKAATERMPALSE